MSTRKLDDCQKSDPKLVEKPITELIPMAIVPPRRS